MSMFWGALLGAIVGCLLIGLLSIAGGGKNGE